MAPAVIGMIVMAGLFGFLLLLIILYFASGKMRKRRAHAREVKQKFKLGQRNLSQEIEISQPKDPKVVTSSDIYMNYY